MNRTHLLLAAMLAGAISSAGLAQAASPSVNTLYSGPYRLVLQIGAVERMDMHGSTEQMLRGQDAACNVPLVTKSPKPTSKRPTCTAHLELHVYRKSGGKIVNTNRVTIQLVGGGKSRPVLVPIMVMQNVKIGHSDLHYGNNIATRPGSYTVRVQVNGVKANFTGVIL